jgi:sulfur-oxidizing protein SoxX
LVRSAIPFAGVWFAAAMSALPHAASAQGFSAQETEAQSSRGSDAQPVRPFAVVGDAIPESLTGKPGDATRGRTLVPERTSTCILCHSGPFPEARFQGDLAPGLNGAGARWSEGQLRLRLVDASRLNPATIMPSYYRVDGLERVGPSWRGKPILSAEQIEDMVAYLTTLRE